MNLRENSARSSVGLYVLLLSVSGGLFLGCGSEPPLGGEESSSRDESSSSDAADVEPRDAGKVELGSSADALPPVADASDTVLGRALGGGDLARLELVELFQSPADMFCDQGVCNGGIPTDLEFNPTRPSELWVVFRQQYDGQPCRQQGDSSGCSLLRGAVAIISGADQEQPDVLVKEDGNSWHFMRLVTSLAFAQDGTFATVGEDRTGNFHDSAVDYMGPSLWSSDPDVFAVDFGRNGSHLDMLHATPYGMGIAHQKEHIFFAFNGQIGSVDAYDFKAPHEPGGEDHSDGELYRYAEGALLRQPGVPSHMQFLDDGTTLLIADTGNQRVVALDTDSGQLGEALDIVDGQIADPRRITDARLSVLVEPGLVQAPSGLVVGPETFAVGDAATGAIHQFSFDGTPLGVLQTGLPPWALGGLELGPDENLYLTRSDEASVLRIERRQE